jgi:hypothetical protein
MATRNIPKPSFKTCDETSLTLAWEGIGHLEPTDSLRLEYKKPNEEWVAENSVAIEKGESEAVIVEVIDLEPGGLGWVGLGWVSSCHTCCLILFTFHNPLAL